MLDRSVPSFTCEHRAQVDRNSLRYPRRRAVMQRMRSMTSVRMVVGIKDADAEREGGPQAR
jgi:hypothetical protein